MHAYHLMHKLKLENWTIHFIVLIAFSVGFSRCIPFHSVFIDIQSWPNTNLWFIFLQNFQWLDMVFVSMLNTNYLYKSETVIYWSQFNFLIDFSVWKTNAETWIIKTFKTFSIFFFEFYFRFFFLLSAFCFHSINVDNFIYYIYLYV